MPGIHMYSLDRCTLATKRARGPLAAAAVRLPLCCCMSERAGVRPPLSMRAYLSICPCLSVRFASVSWCESIAFTWTKPGARREAGAKGT